MFRKATVLIDKDSQISNRVAARPRPATTVAQIRTLEMTAQPGSYLKKTVDWFTRPGSVQLVNEDRAQLEADYLRYALHDLPFWFDAADAAAAVLRLVFRVLFCLSLNFFSHVLCRY